MLNFGGVFCVRVFAGFISLPFKKKLPGLLFYPSRQALVDRRTFRRNAETTTGESAWSQVSGKLFGMGLDQGSSDGSHFWGESNNTNLWQLWGISLNALFGLVSCNDPCWLGRNKRTMSGWCCTWWANQQRIAIFLAHNEQMSNWLGVFSTCQLFLFGNTSVWVVLKMFPLDGGKDFFCWRLRILHKNYFLWGPWGLEKKVTEYPLGAFLPQSVYRFGLQPDEICFLQLSESLGAAWDMLSFGGHAQTWP